MSFDMILLHCNFTTIDDMKFLHAIFFLLLSAIVNAQWQDSFDDGEIGNNPPWLGDTASFQVNSQGQLQLDAGAAGLTHISSQTNLDLSMDLEWRFFIRQNFSPSSGNYGRIYLVSDQPDLDAPLNGYYLQFGESLTDDAVELFRQDGTTPVSVCRATNGAIASSFAISIRVTRDAIGLWKLFIDYSGGTNYVLETYGAEAMYTSSPYLGILCEYTSGNRTNFYFDDFYAGPLIRDTVSPQLLTITAITANELELQFSEAMDPFSITQGSHYTLVPGSINPVLAGPLAGDASRVQLSFSTPFTPAVQYLLTVQGLTDVSSNPVINGPDFPFAYYPPVQTQMHDVIFTEIMFEPSSSGALPVFEYVELLNLTSQAISLKDWTFSDAASQELIPSYTLHPGSYVVLCSQAACSALEAYGPCIGLASFPVLNNDAGDHVQLRNEQGLLMDEMFFSNETYRDGSKDDGGWSLERIDTSFLCPDPMNWMASASAAGGTPGQAGSRPGTYRDLVRPTLLRAAPLDSISVLIGFSERMDDAHVFDKYQYMISSESLSGVNPDTVMATEDPAQFIIRLPFELDDRIYRLSTGISLTDCPGNSIDNTGFTRFAKPEPHDSADVVINEILFDPLTGGVDFAELYNRSKKVLDLKKWRIAEAPFDDPGMAQGSISLSDMNLLLFPEEYLIFSPKSSDILDRYDSGGPAAMISVKDFPDFNTTEGMVLLYDSMARVMDQLSYSEDQHFPLLTETKGVSLERLSPELAGTASDNWHSASSSEGFATPGRKNSRGWENPELTDGIQVEPKVFSPDNDGYNDFLSVSIRQAGKQSIVRVLVYDMKGRRVRELTGQALIGDQFITIWDGLNDDGQLNECGIYVILTETFDMDGNVRRHKTSCALNIK